MPQAASVAPVASAHFSVVEYKDSGVERKNFGGGVSQTIGAPGGISNTVGLAATSSGIHIGIMDNKDYL